jgi:hypothetical protein
MSPEAIQASRLKKGKYIDDDGNELDRIISYQDRTTYRKTLVL